MLRFALALFIFVCCVPGAGAETGAFDRLEVDMKKEARREKTEEKRDVERRIAGDDDDDDSDDRRRDLIERWTDDFIDTDFKKKSFDDLKDLDGSRAEVGRDRDRSMRPDEADGHDLRRDDIKYLFLDDRDYRCKAKEDEKKTFEELTRPIPGMLHDWVPDHVNRLQNGAFVKEPDNGFPVPYRLNGHLDIQRKLPWEKEP